ncbi:MAG: helix-turn-helix transcriptional regulator [Clostridia bacterium]|nr:helix-turn-helix transcriptional regulator [Clostridia bacterium]MBD5561073.1 helix-turn-helix transcriptional regulator [Clostridia bacterium]
MLYDAMGCLLEENGADAPERFGLSVLYLAQQYLELHFHDSLRIADVAAAVGVPANYLGMIPPGVPDDAEAVSVESADPESQGTADRDQ